MVIILIYRAKFEAMLFALCKDEDSDTASMRFFLNVSFELCLLFAETNNGIILIDRKSREQESDRSRIQGCAMSYKT